MKDLFQNAILEICIKTNLSFQPLTFISSPPRTDSITVIKLFSYKGYLNNYG